MLIWGPFCKFLWTDYPREQPPCSLVAYIITNGIVLLGGGRRSKNLLLDLWSWNYALWWEPTIGFCCPALTCPFVCWGNYRKSGQNKLSHQQILQFTRRMNFALEQNEEGDESSFPSSLGGNDEAHSFQGHMIFLGSSLLMIMPIDRVGFQLVWKYQESVLWVSVGTMNQFSLKMHPGLPMLHAECTHLCPYTESPSLKSCIMFAFFRLSQRH